MFKIFNQNRKVIKFSVPFFTQNSESDKLFKKHLLREML